jgi:hypothetical protein
MQDHDPLRFPIGPFAPKKDLSAAENAGLVEALAHYPEELRFVLDSMNPAQMETPYREGGWTVRQVVHHLPDSHLQGYVRFKLAVTETTPTIKTYSQVGWGELSDAREAPVELSLDLLTALHRRWAYFLRDLKEEDFHRSYLHPELGEVTLATTLQLYVWHGRHHLGHIRLVAEE